MLLIPVADAALVALPFPAVPSAPAFPNSMKSTFAPFVLMPMKLPTRGVVMPEVPLPLVLVLWALFARALMAGELKLPVQPCDISVSL